MSISFITLTNNGYLDYTLNCYKSLKNINCKIPLKTYAIGIDAYNKLKFQKKNVEKISDEKNITFETFRKGKWAYITFYKFEIIYKNLLNNTDINEQQYEAVVEAHDKRKVELMI